MNYGIVFTPLVPTIVLWIALAAIVAISALLLLARARGAAVRVAALALILLALANPSFTREEREPLSSVAAVVIDKSPSQNFGTRNQETAKAQEALVDTSEEDQGAGSARRRGRTGRRRDRRHQTVRRGVLGAVGRPGRSRRRRVPDHRRPRPRHSRQCRSSRFPGAGACAGHRAQGRARPAHRDHRRAPLRHRRTAPDHHLPAGRPGRHRPAREDRRAPRRRGRQRAHDAERPDRQCRDRHQARRPEHRRDRGLAAGERTDAGQQPCRRLHRRRARQAARAAGLRRAAFRRAHLAQSVEVRRQRRPRALHDSAPAGEAGRHADQRIVADRVSDARTVPAEDHTSFI